MNNEVIVVEGVPLTLKQLKYYVNEKRLIIISAKKFENSYRKILEENKLLRKQINLYKIHNMIK